MQTTLDAARLRFLASSPNPNSAMRFLDRLRQQSPADYDRLCDSNIALRYAINIFSYSNFLGELVLSNPDAVLSLAIPGALDGVTAIDDFERRLAELLPGVTLARFRRLQLLRIVLRDVLGLAVLSEITEELSNLADAVLDVSYRRIRGELAARHGEPRLPDGQPCGFSVISLGKLGGQELNYSSDIDLMFIYAGNGETDGPAPLTNKEFYKKVANQYTALLSTYTGDGQCYRVDLRLRPDGSLGEICISADGAKLYYAQRARDWEKQMLIKARISAGEREPGTELLDFVEPLIYRSSLDFRALEAVSETRQRISDKLEAKRAARLARLTGTDVKVTPGGIRDIEFLAQCLQRLYGGREQWVRHGGTMIALQRLRDKELLSAGEYARLTAAYQFLRNIEHRLQLEDDRQTHTLPSDSRQLELLARKMPAESGGERLNGRSLPQRLSEHLAAVQQIYQSVIYSQRPGNQTDANASESETLAPASIAPTLDYRAPQIARASAAAGLHRGRPRFEHFLETVSSSSGLLGRLTADPSLAAKVFDIFEHSPFLADSLLRYPQLLSEIGEPFQLEGGLLQDGADLRRYYRRQMLRIQSDSILNAAPIFSTLGETSVLADSVIAAAYRIAVSEAPSPACANYIPGNQMMVIALGRLGMSEFDVGSDADLIFVIPDSDAGELPFWTSAAERIIHTLISYTGEGSMFAIDTRLRANGREGGLVQSAGAYKAYFESHAEAWEGITYMKSRAVAGHVDRATEFLHELQYVDWRRYGQSMRSRKDLAEMRERLEREQGPRNPLKAGVGGYYDIDFALMYLRLKSAGIFYKVLNTPGRIDVIEKMGHLDREDAGFLREAAAFFRAVDHGQRLLTGHAEGSLPTSPAQLDTLTNLVNRWTPGHLRGKPLEVTLDEIRRRTRKFFDRTFGLA